MATASFHIPQKDLFSKSNLRGRSPPYAFSTGIAFVHPEQKGE
jgi:hypothetical protein